MLQVDIRQPSLQVLVNNTPLDSVFEAEVQSNAYLAADRFSFRAAIGSANDTALAALPIQVEVRFGIGGLWQSLISGFADTLQIDPIRGDICISGRDMTSVFIGASTHESFENLTSSDVATLLAERRGLAIATTPTTELVGRYYQNGHTRSAMSQHGRATTEWDVLCWLAQLERFDVWTNGNTLYFQPCPGDYGSVNITPSECTDMVLRRDLGIAGGFTIEVQSWGSAEQQAISAQSTYGANSSNTGNLITLRPNLSYSDAQQLADQATSQLAGHERLVTYDLPGDIVTAPRMQLLLTQTNTDFDGNYTIYEVERRFSIRGGFRQQVHARGSSWTNS